MTSAGSASDLHERVNAKGLRGMRRDGRLLAMCVLLPYLLLTIAMGLSARHALPRAVGNGWGVRPAGHCHAVNLAPALAALALAGAVAEPRPCLAGGPAPRLCPPMDGR